MDSLSDQPKMLKNEKEYLMAVQLATAITLPLPLKAAIDLDLLEIMAAATTSNCMLSPTEVAFHRPSQKPDASSIVDRILRLLACFCQRWTCSKINIWSSTNWQIFRSNFKIKK